jgi:hypothetical protein
MTNSGIRPGAYHPAARISGNPFSDPETNDLVGQRETVEGDRRLRNLFRYVTADREETADRRDPIGPQTGRAGATRKPAVDAVIGHTTVKPLRHGGRYNRHPVRVSPSDGVKVF